MSALDIQSGGHHYKDCAIQPIEFIHANGLDFFQGNIVKYATRHKAKNGAEDLRKVIHYAQLALELQYGVKPSEDRKSTRLNSSHHSISYAVFCLKKKKK